MCGPQSQFFPLPNQKPLLISRGFWFGYEIQIFCLSFQQARNQLKGPTAQSGYGKQMWSKLSRCLSTKRVRNWPLVSEGITIASTLCF